jgi:hypothetical protein
MVNEFCIVMDGVLRKNQNREKENTTFIQFFILNKHVNVEFLKKIDKYKE